MIEKKTRFNFGRLRFIFFVCIILVAYYSIMYFGMWLPIMEEKE